MTSHSRFHTSIINLDFNQLQITSLDILYIRLVKMPAGYPSLQPAFTVRVDIDAPMQVGGQAGSSLAIVPMVGGTVKSESGFSPAFNGELYVDI